MDDDLRDHIRDVPDFPQPGIVYRDITTLLSRPAAFRHAVDQLAERTAPLGAELVVGIEARGFVLGAPLSLELGVGFVPVRKAGKLPADTHSVGYELEYGVDELEIHRDAVGDGQRVLVVDDLLATGGTAAAATALVAASGGVTAGYAFLVELVELGGRSRLAAAARVTSLVTY